MFAFLRSKLLKLNFIFVYFFSDAAKGLSNLTLSIEPAWVRRGQSAQLYCSYELYGAPLYSVKWYRGNLEFYRYSPFENPPAKIFPFTGIKVDVSMYEHFMPNIFSITFIYTRVLLFVYGDFMFLSQN